MVQAVSLSPSRTLLAVAAADGTLRLWNVARPGHPVALGDPLVDERGNPLYTTVISPDGKVLAASRGRPHRLVVEYLRPGRPVPLGKPLTGPANTVYSVAFSPDGQLMAAGSSRLTASACPRLSGICRPAPASEGQRINSWQLPDIRAVKHTCPL